MTSIIHLAYYFLIVIAAAYVNSSLKLAQNASTRSVVNASRDSTEHFRYNKKYMRRHVISMQLDEVTPINALFQITIPEEKRRDMEAIYHRFRLKDLYTNLTDVCINVICMPTFNDFYCLKQA